MFPGQGAQSVGMGKVLANEFPLCRTVFEEAEDAIGLSLRKLCFDGPDADLKLTANTQPCILMVSIAQWHVLANEAGLKPTVFLGHSLGEYGALVASGKLAFSTAMKLVRRRGEEMQNAVPVGVGAMAAVLSCPVDRLSDLVAHASSTDAIVSIVNYNSASQLVVAGHKAAVDRLCRALEAEKFRFVHLAVSAPFHSTLMEPAKEAMRPYLLASQIKGTATSMIPNLLGTVTTDYKIDYLIEQIDHPVLWMQSLETTQALGCTTYVEVGPGKVLTGLAKRSLPPETKLIVGDNTKAAIAALVS